MEGEGRGASVKPPLVDDLGVWNPRAFLHVHRSRAALGQRAPLAVDAGDGLPGLGPKPRTTPIPSSRCRSAMSGQ
jgi:hypothetical protein